MAGGYTVLPAFYDFLGKHPDYARYAEAMLCAYARYGAKESGLTLDLACGTGKLTVELLERGADVIGVDLSPEMLNVARENCAKKGFAPLLLCQDMKELDLYGTVDLAICATNSLNYLEKNEELHRVFSLVHNFLTPGGLFFFDVDSLYKFETLYGENSYVFETDDCFCAWQNDYDRRSKTCDFYLDIFEKRPNGMYKRSSETQRQKYFSENLIEKTLKNVGFELLFKGGDYNGGDLFPTAPDIFYLAKCIKE